MYDLEAELQKRPMTLSEALNPPEGHTVVKYHTKEWYKENCYVDSIGDFWENEEDYKEYECNEIETLIDENINKSNPFTLKCILDMYSSASQLQYALNENIQEELWGIITVMENPLDYPEEWV